MDSESSLHLPAKTAPTGEPRSGSGWTPIYENLAKDETSLSEAALIRLGVTPAQQEQAAIKAPPTYGAETAAEKLVPRTCLRRKNSPSVLTTMRN